MSAGWEVGDRALCVDSTPCPATGRSSGELTTGAVYTVLSLHAGNSVDRHPVGLNFCEIPAPHDAVAYVSIRFRKIKPDAHEDCEPEFVTLLNRIKHSVAA